MLLVMLGAVLMLMKQLQRPEAAGVLGKLFSPAAEGNYVAKTARDSASSPPVSQNPVASAPLAREKSGPWAAVKDNATFLPAENEAWFLLWDEVRRKPLAELERLAAGEVAYAQLVEQPDVYRGAPVRVRGRILREELKQAPENSLGIETYHLLTLAPRGGGDWPIRVYCLELPTGFPRGRDLAIDLDVVGLFFKNWSFAYDGGLGLAPVIVTKTLNWQAPRPIAIAPHTVGISYGVWAAAGSAVLAAGVFLVWVRRQTRRTPSAELPAPRFDSLDLPS
jgi:hypothetical protein